MSLPRVVAVAPGSPAARAGLAPGDEVLAVAGRVPRDVLEWRQLVDDADVELEVRRGGLDRTVVVDKRAGEALGAEVHSSVFDQVRTCDNHCEFCFIYQLPKGLRKSLYLKDDDYRLSFLYGNFTTLTRFTEADLERVISEGLSPLNVSIHATDPAVRTRMLRNRRGATSLRWLRALLDHGVTVHGQVVVCPGINDGDVLADTLAGILDEYPELATVCVVPLGISAHSNEAAMRPHTTEEAAAVVDLVERWQATYLELLGRRLVFAADEYYLLADRPFPASDTYEGFPMHEDGIGMARTFELEFTGQSLDGAGVGSASEQPESSEARERDHGHRVRPGFFQWVDGAPAEGYRAPRGTLTVRRRNAPVAVLTGTYGARVLEPLLVDLGRDDVRVLEVENRFFGGNIGVTGLLVGEDLTRVLAEQPESHRYLLPDVCLTQGRVLDGLAPEDLPRPVEVVRTDGAALRAALAR
jgi:putative radical SAM enzyme (TIGR03279 family)